MQRNKMLLLSLILAASFSHAQGTPSGEADPLDVLDRKPVDSPTSTPEVPSFVDVPPPEVTTPSEVSQPSEVSLPSEGAPTEMQAPVANPARRRKKKSANRAARPDTVSNLAVGSDEPDLKREEKFHEIYQKFNSEPTSEEAWERAIGSRKSELYKVQKGDTLWDVSNTFFGDPSYWPKLWSLNVGGIGNPHEIDDSMSVQFFPGSMQDPPTLSTVVNSKITQSGPPGGTNVASNVNVPLPANKKHVPLLKQLPASIPLYRYGSVLIPAPTIDLPKRKNNFIEQPEFLTYYVTEQNVDSVGQVVETEMGMTTAAEFQYVIVKLNSTAEKTLTAVKELDHVTDLENKESEARLFEVQGSIEVMEKVNSGENLYRAIVKKNLHPIAVGARLMAGPIPTFNPVAGPVDADHSALIIGGQFENERKLFGSRAIVFLNGGTKEGFQVGQTLNVYSDIRNRNPNSAAQTNDRVNGALKIIKVTPNFSTAFVIRATDDIFVGDHVGSKRFVATEPSAAQPSADTSEAEVKDADALDSDELEL